MSLGKLTLNYLEHPIGLAVMSLKGDLSKAVNQRELRLIRAHWQLASRYFRKRSRRLGRRRLNGIASEITGGLTKEEMYLVWLKTARKSLEAYGVGLY
jgi:hypothetical protein